MSVIATIPGISISECWAMPYRNFYRLLVKSWEINQQRKHKADGGGNNRT